MAHFSEPEESEPEESEPEESDNNVNADEKTIPNKSQTKIIMMTVRKYANQFGPKQSCFIEPIEKALGREFFFLFGYIIDIYINFSISKNSQINVGLHGQNTTTQPS